MYGSNNWSCINNTGLPRFRSISQYVTESIGINATLASAKLVKLASGAKSEYVQLEASKDILDRAGFKAPDKHMHLHAGEIKVNIDLS